MYNNIFYNLYIIVIIKVGGPIRNVEFKVVDVPDMKYFSTDLDVLGNNVPRGEILFRGP